MRAVAANINDFVQKSRHTDRLDEWKHRCAFHWTQMPEADAGSAAAHQPIICHCHRALPFAELWSNQQFIFEWFQLIYGTFIASIPELNATIFRCRIQTLIGATINPMHVIGVTVKRTQHLSIFKGQCVNVVVTATHIQNALLLVQPKAVDVVLLTLIVWQTDFPRFFVEPIFKPRETGHDAGRADNQEVVVECQTSNWLTVFGRLEDLMWSSQCLFVLNGIIRRSIRVCMNPGDLLVWCGAHLRNTEKIFFAHAID